jgi:branched-chain amino acid transport system ATP-binding protein
MERRKVNNMTLLSIRNLSLNFGGVTALKDFSLEAKDKEILGLIGPNNTHQCINKGP